MDYEDDYDDFAETIDDEYDDEPIDSCERCSGNVYEDEGHLIGGDWYCDQCAWWMTHSEKWRYLN